MVHSHRFELRLLSLACAVLWVLVTTPATVRAQAEERTNLTVVVTESENGQPIPQARLTLQFREPGNPAKLKRSKPIAYSAKTNAQGRYRFTNLPKGTIRLLVTAERRQSFGKEFELEQDNQVIDVRLKKPQPLL